MSDIPSDIDLGAIRPYDGSAQMIPPSWACVDDMTLLDWFAGQAYTEAVEIVTVRGVERCREILESEEEPEPEPDDDTDRADLIAREAYRLAAAMIAEKRRREGGAA